MANDTMQLPPGYEDAKPVKAQQEQLQLPPGYEDAKSVKPVTPPATASVVPPKKATEPGIYDKAKQYVEGTNQKVDTAVTSALETNPENLKSFVKTQAIEVPKTLGRELYTGIKTAYGMPKAMYHAVIDPATEAEKAVQLPGELAAGEKPGTETSGLKRIGLAGERMLGLSEGNPLSAYGDEKTRPTYEQILENAPEALGQGAGVVVGGKALEAGGGALKEGLAVPEVKSAVTAPVRAVSRAVKPVAPLAGYGVGAAVGGAFGHPWLGSMLGRIALPTDVVKAALEKGTTVGLPKEVADAVHLDNKAIELEKIAAETQAEVDRYKASAEQGIRPPEDVIKANDKAQRAASEARFHADAAKSAADKYTSKRANTVEGEWRNAPETPTEDITAKPALKQLGEPETEATPMPKINVKTPGQVQPETFPQVPTEKPRPSIGQTELAGEQGTMGKPPLLTEGKVEGVPTGLTEEPMPKAPEPEAPKPATASEMKSLKAEGGKVVDKEETTPEGRIGKLLQEALKPEAPKAEAAKAPEAPAVERRKETTPVETERRGMAPNLQALWQENVFGKKAEGDVGTKVRESNPEPTGRNGGNERRALPRDQQEARAASDKLFTQARTELGENASSDDITKRMEELKSAAKPTLPTEEPTSYTAKKEEVVPAGTEGRTPAKSAEEYHPAVEQKVNELSDENLRKLAKAHGLNPDEYDFNARDERRHRVERDQLSKDITAQLGEDEKINLGRAAEATEKQGTFAGADVSAKGRADRAAKMFPRLRGPVDEFGNPKISGGAPETVGTKEAADKDNEHFANAKKELGGKASISEVAKRAQELKDVHAQVDAHDENGGSTFSSKGKNLNGTNKYSVGSYPDRTEHIDNLTPERLEEFKNNNADLLSKEDHAVGTWKDPDTGKAVLDVTKLYTDRDAAIVAGKDANQKSIYHLGGEGEIETGGTGKPEPSAANAKLSDEELKAKGFTQEDIDAGEHLPPVSGGAPSALPTGDALIKKYGESSGDPKDLTFILKDGRGVANTGIEHDHMLGGKTNEKNPPRERFIAEGNIRVRPRMGQGGREVALSIPEAGVNQAQLDYLNKMAPQLKSGAVMVEVGKRGGDYKVIPYGEATPETLEKTVRGLGPVLNDKGAPIDEFGNPTVSGGSQAAGVGAAKSKDALEFIKENSNVLPAGKISIDDIGDAGKRHFLLSDGSMISEKVPIHSDIEGMVGGKNLQAAKAIRMAGPAEFDVYSEPTPQQVRELGRILKDYREEHQYGKIYWSITDSLGKEVGNAGTFGDFQRDLETAYPDKNQTAIKDLQKSMPDLAQKHLTEAEKESITTTATGKPRTAGTAKFIENMEKIPAVREYKDIALQGEGARKWYSRSTAAFDAMHEEAPDYFKKGDKDKFMGVLASSSPQQAVVNNLRETLGFWKEWHDAGRPDFSMDKWKQFGDEADKAWKDDGSPRAGGTMKGASQHWDYAPTGPEWKAENLLLKSLTLPETKVPNIIKAIHGEQMWPDLTKNASFKAPSFAENLRKWIEGKSTGTKNVTNDSWMGLFGGIDESALSKPENYHPLSVATRAAAEELGWEPEEAQAAIWSFTQALTEKGVEDSELVRHYSEDFKDILANDLETRGILEKLGVNLDQLDRKLEAIGEKPEVSGRSTPTTAHSVGQLRGRIEEARGKGAIPEPKSVQGSLFRENPAFESRSRLRDESTEFNPDKFRTQTDEPLTKLGEKKKKSPYGNMR